MENSSKALYIAGSLLIAVSILSLLMFTFKGMGKAQSRQDEQASEQEIINFNKEYEAFNKRIMSAVEVVSCINKAISNNESAKDQKDYDRMVDVHVKTYSELTESVQIYLYRNGSNKFISKDSLDEDTKSELSNFILNKKMFILFNITGNKYKKLCTKLNESVKLNNLTPGQGLDNKDNYKMDIIVVEKSSSRSSPYKWDGLLTTDNIPNENSNLRKLIQTQKSYSYKFKDAINNNEYNLVWTTAINDFWKLKFQCTSVEYSENNSRVKSLTFEEK